jgi:hypothetical protein
MLLLPVFSAQGLLPEEEKGEMWSRAISPLSWRTLSLESHRFPDCLYPHGTRRWYELIQRICLRDSILIPAKLLPSVFYFLPAGMRGINYSSPLCFRLSFSLSLSLSWGRVQFFKLWPATWPFVHVLIHLSIFECIVCAGHHASPLGHRSFYPEYSAPVTLILGEGAIKSEEQLVNWDWEEMEASTIANSVIDAS